MRRLWIELALTIACVGTRATAGERNLDVTLANMTPTAAASRSSGRCVKTIVDRVGRGEVTLGRVGETVLRKAAGQGHGEAFTAWSATVAERLHDRFHADTIVLIDCRPEVQTFEAVVMPPLGGAVHISLEGAALDDKTVGTLSDAIAGRAWMGFVP